MRVYLIQHGEAKPEEEDQARHLTEHGIEAVKKVAAFLEPLHLQPQAIWHSGKARAQQTAEILGTTIKAEEGMIQKEGLAPKDPVASIKQTIEEGSQDVMIVGHLPFLSKLAGLMVVGDETKEVVRFHYAGVVCLESAASGKWRVAWMVVPGMLR